MVPGNSRRPQSGVPRPILNESQASLHTEPARAVPRRATVERDPPAQGCESRKAARISFRVASLPILLRARHVPDGGLEVLLHRAPERTPSSQGTRTVIAR